MALLSLNMAQNWNHLVSGGTPTQILTMPMKEFMKAKW
jgi:hypothetical protein